MPKSWTKFGFSIIFKPEISSDREFRNVLKFIMFLFLFVIKVAYEISLVTHYLRATYETIELTNEIIIMNEHSWALFVKANMCDNTICESSRSRETTARQRGMSKRR